MYNYTILKQFAANINKATRMLTDGKFNSSELAIMYAIKEKPKNIEEIANDIGMSKPTVHSLLTTNVRRKYIKVLPDKDNGHYMYILNDLEVCNVLEKILEPLNQDEQKVFMDCINRINNNINSNILNTRR